MQILPATTEHFAAILALNEEYVDVLAPLTLDQLVRLHLLATYHRVAVDGADVAGFLIAFGSGTDHPSVNFRWFAERLSSFLYVDRIAVATRWQRRGVGAMLYQDLFAFARREGYELVTCEINSDPPNPRSARFHERLGFEEIGGQRVEYVAGKPKRVSMRAVRLSGIDG